MSWASVISWTLFCTVFAIIGYGVAVGLVVLFIMAGLLTVFRFSRQ